jgi:hypothetical protein
MQIPEFRDLCAHDVPFFDQWNARPSNAKPHSSEGGNYAKCLPRDESKTRSILMCERSFWATHQSAKYARARWRAKFTIGEEGLGIGSTR